MKLYLVKSDKVKVRYFFRDETKAQELYNRLVEENSDVVLKYLKTSDEWSVEELVSRFNLTKESYVD